MELWHAFCAAWNTGEFGLRLLLRLSPSETL